MCTSDVKQIKIKNASPKVFIEDITNGEEEIKISFSNELDDQKPPQNVLYIANNVLSSDSLMEDFESLPVPCKCRLCSDHCSCALGGNIAYKNQRLREDFVLDNSRPILECSNLCECEIICHNRVVQHGIKYSLQVFKTENKGFGVQTLEFISMLSFVCEYAGELIDKNEAQQRMKNRSVIDPNYIFILKEHSASNAFCNTIIDPTYMGNIGRYLNHSCSPNLLPIPIRVDSMLPRICFFAKRDIQPHEELTYDYGIGECQSNVNNQRDLTVKENSKPCHCNTSICFGTLPFDAEALL